MAKKEPEKTNDNHRKDAKRVRMEPRKGGVIIEKELVTGDNNDKKA